MNALYLFSGAQRKSSVTSVLQDLCRNKGLRCKLHDVDIQNSPDWDLTKGAVQQALLDRIKKGEFDVVLVTPPCSTWSRVRGANCRGPPAIRSKDYPWGFPWLSSRHQKDAELGNILIVFMLEVLETLGDHPVAASGRAIIIFGEHPEDLGVIRREEDGMIMEPASIWQLHRMRVLLFERAALNLSVAGGHHTASLLVSSQTFRHCGNGVLANGQSSMLIATTWGPFSSAPVSYTHLTLPTKLEV